jgi:TonB family protein
VVKVEILIGIDGRVAQTRLLRSLHPDLDLEAIAAARRWKFKPALLDGQPVSVTATVELSFRLK